MSFTLFNNRMVFVLYLCAMNLLTAAKDLVFILFFYGLIAAIFAILYRKTRQKPQPPEEVTHADSDIIPVEFRGEYITMTYWEYLNTWQNLNREEKNKIYTNQMRRLKDGSVIKRYINEKEYLIEATYKGRKYIAINEKRKLIQ